MRPEPRPASVEEILAHSDWVRRLALGLVGNEAGADDLTQEALLRAIERPPAQGSSLRAWFARVVRNLAIDHGRRRQRRQAREWKVVEGQAGPTAGTEVEVQQPGDIHARLEMQEQLAQAVRELPEPYRTTTVLYYFDQLGTEEIAARLGVQSSTVRNQLSRSRARLRERLERRFGGDWRALCIGLFLRPAAVPPPPPPPAGIPAGVAGAMAAGLLLAVAYMTAGKFMPEPLDAATQPVAASLPSTATATLDDQEPARVAVEPVREAASVRKGGLILQDLNGDTVRHASVRVYGERWQGSTVKIVGPERNQFDRYPLLEEARSDDSGFVALEVLNPESMLSEPQLACVIEAPGFVKRVVRIETSLEGDAVHETVRLSRAGFAHVQIVNAAGWPVEGATVSLQTKGVVSRADDFERVAIETDGDGIAVLSSAPAKANLIQITCPGYLRQRTAFALASDGLPERPEVFVLERGGEASVSVYGWTGVPYAGAEVYLKQGQDDPHRRRWTWSHNFVGETGEDGYLAFGGIDETKRCQVVVRIDGVEVETDEVFAGGHVDVSLPPLAELRGELVQGDGSPASHALVGVYNLEGTDKRSVSHAWSKPDGSFSLTVEAGLHGMGFWHKTGSLVDQAPRQLEPGVIDLGQVRLPEGRSIFIEVLERDGMPVRGEIELLMRKPLSVASTKNPIEPGEWRDFLSTGAKTVLPFRLPGGRFVISHLPAGSHEYSVVSKAHQPKMIQLDGATSPELVQVKLDRAVPVRLRLVDARGEAVAGEAVTFSLASYDWDWAERKPPVRQPHGPSLAKTDANGFVEFGRIAPGQWVLARQGDARKGLEIARLMVPSEGIDTEVMVEDPIRLRVSLADEQPVPEGSRVLVHSASGRAGGASADRAWRNPNAAFEASAPAGAQTVDVALPGSLPRSAAVTVDAGDSAEVEVEVEGADLYGEFPRAAERGRVLLVADDAARLPGRDALIAALRDNVHHELGGHLPLPNGGRGLPFALTRVAADGHFLFRKIPDGRYRLYGTAPGLQLSRALIVVVEDGKPRLGRGGQGGAVLEARLDAEMDIEVRGLVRLLARSPKLSVVLAVRRQTPHTQSSFNEMRVFRLLPDRTGPEFAMQKEPAGMYELQLRVVSAGGEVHARLDCVIETREGHRISHELEVPNAN